MSKNRIENSCSLAEWVAPFVLCFAFNDNGVLGRSCGVAPDLCVLPDTSDNYKWLAISTSGLLVRVARMEVWDCRLKKEKPTWRVSGVREWSLWGVQEVNVLVDTENRAGVLLYNGTRFIFSDAPCCADWGLTLDGNPDCSLDTIWRDIIARFLTITERTFHNKKQW